MAGERQAETVAAGDPFGGLSCLPWRREGGARAAIAVNVDSSRGTIKPRPGCRVLLDTGSGNTILGVHGFLAVDGTPLVAAVLQQPDLSVYFQCFRSSGDLVCSQGMVDIARGLAHPPDEDGRVVSWADYAGVVYFAFEHGVLYQYDYLRQPDQPTVAEAQDSPHDVNWPYLQTVPRGSVWTVHKSQLVVAHVDSAAWLDTNITIPEEQAELDESNVGEGRSSVKYGLGTVLLSDPGRPRAFRSTSFLVPAAGEQVVGLASTEAGLLMFTRRSVHVLEPHGPALVGQSRRELVAGVGCVGHRTVVVGRGLVAWLSYDGVYVHEGGRVSRISDDIEDLWHESGWRPEAMATLSESLATLGYPWKIARSLLDRACGGFDQIRQQFWWAVPLSGADHHNALCLVWSAVTREWSLYLSAQSADDSQQGGLVPTCFASWLNGTRWECLIGTAFGHVLVYGDAPTDPTQGRHNDPLSVVAVWQSAPLSPDPDTVWDADGLRLRQKATADVGAQATLFLEAELAFDVPQAELSSNQLLVARPSGGAPGYSGSVEYQYNNGTWDAFYWHSPRWWSARYPVSGSLSGASFTVGFRMFAKSEQAAEVARLALRCWPSKDLV